MEVVFANLREQGCRKRGPGHSDPNSKKVSKKSDFVWKYIIGFHLLITGHWSPLLCEK